MKVTEACFRVARLCVIKRDFSGYVFNGLDNLQKTLQDGSRRSSD